ncbi:MAG TPA: nucleotide-binding domain containing protein, partial [Puia sp.]
PDELGVLPGYPVLFISGTTFGKNQVLIRGIYEAGGPVSYISADAVSAGSHAEEPSFETIVNHLLDQGKAVVAIEGTATEDPVQAARTLREWMARLVRRVLAEVDVEELVIEGGATAYAILVQAGLRAFFPEEELAPGMVRMRAQADFPLYVTVKPGSYEWPALVRHRLEN